MKKIYIKTMGCQMNVYDTHRILDAFAALGYTQTQHLIDADVMMINTCHIREKAAEKVFSELGRMKDVKDARTAQGKSTLMGVTGCVVQAWGDTILQKVKYLDFAVGTQSYHLLPELVTRFERGQKRTALLDFTSDEKFKKLPTPNAHGVSAFLAIQEGCDNFCAYCVVPYTRGCEYSRDAQSVLDEAKHLVNTGAKEIMLLGQNVDCWHGQGTDGKKWGLAQLLTRVCAIDGLERVRYTTSYPVDITDEVIAAHRDLPKLMPYIHLPIQAGSDKTLKAMNRRYTVAQYLDVVERLRKARPDIAISSDFIVGFPNESDADFEQTVAVAKQVGYAQSYSFKYSARAGTPASLMSGQISEAVKKERLAILQAVLTDSQKAFNQSFLTKTLPVLFSEEQKTGQMSGYTPYMQSVHVKTDKNLIGQILPVQISRASSSSLSGVLACDTLSSKVKEK